MFEKSTPRLVQRCLAKYLPSLQTEIVRVREPLSTWGVHVRGPKLTAADYAVRNGEWFHLAVPEFVSARPLPIGVRDGTGVHLVSAVIAGDVARQIRVMLHPTKSDAFVEEVAGVDRATLAVLFNEACGFLYGLNHGQIAFTDGADEMATILLAGLAEDVARSTSEAREAAEDSAAAETATDQGDPEQFRRAPALPAVSPELEALRDLVDETFGVFETEFVYRQAHHSWALNIRQSSFDWYSVIREGDRWIDDDGSLGSDEDDSPSNGSDERALVMIAFRVGLGVLDEWHDGDLHGRFRMWFDAASEYLIAVRDRENPSGSADLALLRKQADAFWSTIRFNVMEKP